MAQKTATWTWDDYRRDFPGAPDPAAGRASARRGARGIGAGGAAGIEGGSTQRETATVREPPAEPACGPAGAGLAGKPGAEAPQAAPSAPMPTAAAPTPEGAVAPPSTHLAGCHAQACRDARLRRLARAAAADQGDAA